MPLPTPKNNEKKDDFVSRCASELADEGDRWPDNDQRIAVCFKQWEKKNEESSVLKRINRYIMPELSEKSKISAQDVIDAFDGIEGIKKKSKAKTLEDAMDYVMNGIHGLLKVFDWKESDIPEKEIRKVLSKHFK